MILPTLICTYQLIYFSPLLFPPSPYPSFVVFLQKFTQIFLVHLSERGFLEARKIREKSLSPTHFFNIWILTDIYEVWIKWFCFGRSSMELSSIFQFLWGDLHKTGNNKTKFPFTSRTFPSDAQLQIFLGRAGASQFREKVSPPPKMTFFLDSAQHLFFYFFFVENKLLFTIKPK